MTLSSLNITVLRAALWDIFQSIFGANQEKCRIYREATNCHTGDSVLDFGCATGITAQAFLDCEYVGVDIDVGAIAWARYKYRNNKNIEFRCCDVSKINEKKFSRVLCAGTGHHLSDFDLKKYQVILASLVPKQGSLHFIDIVRTKNDNLVMKLLMAIDQGRHIRTADRYLELFEEMPNIKIEKSSIACGDGWFTKASFISLTLKPT